MLNFAHAIRAGRARHAAVARWESFLLRAAAVHSHRILRDDWNPVSTNEAFFIAPLAESFTLFQDPLFRQAALKAGEYYARRHVNMREPYWGGTSDAKC